MKVGLSGKGRLARSGWALTCWRGRRSLSKFWRKTRSKISLMLRGSRERFISWRSWDIPTSYNSMRYPLIQVISYCCNIDHWNIETAVPHHGVCKWWGIIRLHCEAKTVVGNWSLQILLTNNLRGRIYSQGSHLSPRLKTWKLASWRQRQHQNSWFRSL